MYDNARMLQHLFICVSLRVLFTSSRHTVSCHLIGNLHCWGISADNTLSHIVMWVFSFHCFSLNSLNIYALFAVFRRFPAVLQNKKQRNIHPSQQSGTIPPPNIFTYKLKKCKSFLIVPASLCRATTIFLSLRQYFLKPSVLIFYLFVQLEKEGSLFNDKYACMHVCLYS